MSVECTYATPRGRVVTYLLGALLAAAGVLGACSSDESSGEPPANDGGSNGASSGAGTSGSSGNADRLGL